MAGPTADDVIGAGLLDLGELGGLAPRGKVGRAGGGYPSGGGRLTWKSRPARARAAVRARTRKLGPASRRRVGGGALVAAGAAMLAAGAAAGARGGGSRAERPMTKRQLAQAFTPRTVRPSQAAAFRGVTPSQQIARSIRETSAAVDRLAQQGKYSRRKAAQALRSIAALKKMLARR